MSSQDYRVQENRYRQDDFADDPRRERYEDARRYQSGRRDFQGQAGYGRGRDFGPRDEYGRDGDAIGRRWSEPSGRGRYEEEYFGEPSVSITIAAASRVIMGTPNWRAMAAARPVNIKLVVIAEANAIMA